MIDTRSSIYLGHLGPIPLYVHWTAILMLYFAWSWTGGSTQVFDIVAMLLVLVVSIVLHELGHGFAALIVARREVEKAVVIILWAFGGVCISQGRDGRPWKELFIVLAGPAVSLVLWLGCLLAIDQLPKDQLYTFTAGDVSTTTLGHLLHLGSALNLALLIFNMLPIYPFDGGQAVHNGFKLFIKNYDLARNLSFTISVVTAAGYLGWSFHRSHEIPWFAMILIGFMLYQGYIALFIYRR